MATEPTVEEVMPGQEKPEPQNQLSRTMRMLVDKFASFLQFSVDYNDQTHRQISKFDMPSWLKFVETRNLNLFEFSR